MAPVKRQAVALESAAKRVKPVAKALKDCKDYPGSLLASCLQFSLGVFKEVRSPMQIEMVGYVGDALASLEKDLEAESAEAAAGCDNVYAIKAERIKARQAAQAAMEGLKQALAAAQSEEGTAKAGADAADAALSAAEDEQNTCDAEFNAVMAKKAKIKAAEVDAYAHLKEDALDGAAQKKALKTVVSTGRAFGFESSLLDSAPSSLGKKPETRSDFDKIVIDKLQEEFTKFNDALEAQSKALEPAKAERAAKVEAAKSASEAAALELQAKKDAVKAAKASLKAGEQALSGASASVKNWIHDIKALFDASDEAKSALADFQEGPLKTFSTLKVMETPPPVEEEEEKEEKEEEEENEEPVDGESSPGLSKRYKLLDHPHLGLNLSVGDVYTEKALLEKCHGDQAKTEALLTKLADSNTFLEVSS